MSAMGFFITKGENGKPHLAVAIKSDDAVEVNAIICDQEHAEVTVNSLIAGLRSAETQLRRAGKLVTSNGLEDNIRSEIRKL
jgi:hypothetical protein